MMPKYIEKYTSQTSEPESFFIGGSFFYAGIMKTRGRQTKQEDDEEKSDSDQSYNLCKSPEEKRRWKNQRD